MENKPLTYTYSIDRNYQASLPRADPTCDEVWVPGNHSHFLIQTAAPRRIPAKSLGVVALPHHDK